VIVIIECNLILRIDLPGRNQIKIQFDQMPAINAIEQERNGNGNELWTFVDQTFSASAALSNLLHWPLAECKLVNGQTCNFLPTKNDHKFPPKVIHLHICLSVAQIPEVRPHHAAHEPVRLLCGQQLALAGLVPPGHAEHGAAAPQSGKWAHLANA